MSALVNAAFVRTMAAYNAEMNRRLYAAAGRLPDAERRKDRGAFWGSLHGTLSLAYRADDRGVLAVVDERWDTGAITTRRYDS